jgi:GNAT superfamily N-acetyltransferase
MHFVRQATLDDLPTLGVFDEWKAASEERVRAGHCYVAGTDGPALAFGVLDRSFMNRSFIAILFVHPGHRRVGLASHLIRHFETLSETPKLWISTNIENLPMQRVLHKHGYGLAGVVNELGALPELFYFKQINASVSLE